MLPGLRESRAPRVAGLGRKIRMMTRTTAMGHHLARGGRRAEADFPWGVASLGGQASLAVVAGTAGRRVAEARTVAVGLGVVATQAVVGLVARARLEVVGQVGRMVRLVVAGLEAAVDRLGRHREVRRELLLRGSNQGAREATISGRISLATSWIFRVVLLTSKSSAASGRRTRG